MCQLFFPLQLWYLWSGGGICLGSIVVCSRNGQIFKFLYRLLNFIEFSLHIQPLHVVNNGSVYLLPKTSRIYKIINQGISAKSDDYVLSDWIEKSLYIIYRAKSLQIEFTVEDEDTKITSGLRYSNLGTITWSHISPAPSITVFQRFFTKLHSRKLQLALVPW